ncbi:MAG: transposase [Victivallales bacterium]|nr:transposase [Victivallales bacterium]
MKKRKKIVRGSEEINSIGGISLIGELFNNLKNMKKVDSMQMAKIKTGRISHSEILKSTATLFAIGKNDYADIELFNHGPFFLDCLQLSRDEENLLINDIEVNTFWTNLTENAETVIKLYHAHGTSEQFHSELKTDLDSERLPSGKFATNSRLFLLAMLAFSILRILGQAALQMKNALPRKFNVQRRRLRSVIQDLIYIARKRVRHAGSILLKFGRHCPWFEVFQKLHIKFC